MPKPKHEQPHKLSGNCKDCTPVKTGVNHHRCFSLGCICIFHKAYAPKRMTPDRPLKSIRSATREEQHARYIDCGPNNWDDRD